MTIPALYEPVEETEDLGPAMRKIRPQQRAFVLAMLDTGGTDNTRAAGLAGYCPNNPEARRVTAYRLAHTPAILEAIREEANKRIHSGVILGASVLIEIANDPTHKDRLKAATQLLDRGGLLLASQHNIVVEHRGQDKETIEQIKVMAKELGIDPKKLLGSAGVVIDADFEEVVSPDEDPWTVGPEDVKSGE